MLILTRTEGQSIVIGDNIVITVVRIRPWGLHEPRVRLGIAAPPEVVVDRQEIHERRQAGVPHPTRREGV